MTARMQWLSRAPECEPDLDQLMLAVLRRTNATWQVTQLDVCATEPPYWDPQFLTSTRAPCELFAGLKSAVGTDLSAQCQTLRRRPPKQ